MMNQEKWLWNYNNAEGDSLDKGRQNELKKIKVVKIDKSNEQLDEFLLR